jgi:zinc/manganese transport system substrate-binding protein
MGIRWAAAGIGAALVLVVAGCGGAANTPTSASGGCLPVEIVATTSILGDVVRNVAGDGARVEVLIPPGADPHSFAPSASQAAALRGAGLVVANGLGLEEGLLEVIEAAAADGVIVVEAASFVDPLPFAGGDHEDEASEGHEDEGESHEEDEHGTLDPHIWTDPARMAEVVAGLGEALAAADPDCAAAYRTAAEAYAADLLALDAEIERILAAVPAENRKLVTNHHTLGYFADRHGFEVIGAVIPGGSTLAEPSPADLARLVETLRREGVRAVFAENTRSGGLVEALAAELGEGVAVVSLFSDALGAPGSGAIVMGRRGINKSFFGGKVSYSVSHKLSDAALWLVP